MKDGRVKVKKLSKTFWQLFCYKNSKLQSLTRYNFRESDIIKIKNEKIL